MDTSDPNAPPKPTDNGTEAEDKPQADASSQDNAEPVEKKPKEPKKPKKIVHELPIVKLAGYSIPLEAFINFEVILYYIMQKIMPSYFISKCRKWI